MFSTSTVSCEDRGHLAMVYKKLGDPEFFLDVKQIKLSLQKQKKKTLKKKKTGKTGKVSKVVFTKSICIHCFLGHLVLVVVWYEHPDQ